MPIYTMSQFKETFRMFSEFTGATSKTTYEEWEASPEDHKAAILFVTFFDSISLAWYKTKGEHTYAEDGVDEAMHICSKLCGKSTKKDSPEKAKCDCAINAKTFTPEYIYNAMRNAFSSLNYDRRACRSQYRHEDDDKHGCITVQAQYFTGSDGSEQDIFSTVVKPMDFEREISSDPFWSIIDVFTAESDAVKAIYDSATKEERAEKGLKSASDTMRILNRLLSLSDKASSISRDINATTDAKDKACLVAQLQEVEACRTRYMKNNRKIIENIRSKVSQVVQFATV